MVDEKFQPLDPTLKPPPVMAHVMAPSTLPEGYTFEAQLGGDPTKTFTVEVPAGGVNEGDTFLAPVPDGIDIPRIKAPTGQWKDSLFSFFSAGFCSPHLWCALCCTQIALGQVMTRMQLTWIGEPGPWMTTRTTFKVVVWLVISYTIYESALQLAEIAEEESNPYSNVSPFLPIFKTLGNVLFWFWFLYALCKTRESVRARYSIPEQNCEGCEDLVCATFCSCCSIAQMARHTGDFDNYPSSCCTDTGLPKGSPLAV